ncbi:Elongation factor 2, partial [Linum perenne]
NDRRIGVVSDRHIVVVVAAFDDLDDYASRLFVLDTEDEFNEIVHGHAAFSGSGTRVEEGFNEIVHGHVTFSGLGMPYTQFEIAQFKMATDMMFCNVVDVTFRGLYHATIKDKLSGKDMGDQLEKDVEGRVLLPLKSERERDKFVDRCKKEKQSLKDTGLEYESNKRCVADINSFHHGHADFSFNSMLLFALLMVPYWSWICIEEGACVHIETVLCQALSKRIRPVLTVNKMDRYFLELQLDGEEAYHGVIENAYPIMCTYEDPLLGDVHVYPDEGTVAFSASLYGCANGRLGNQYISKMIPVSKKGRFFELGLLFFNKVYNGVKVRIMGPDYVPGEKKDLYVKNVQGTAIWRGKRQEMVEDVPCGNNVALPGLDGFIMKNTTLNNEKEVDALPIREMKFFAPPVVRLVVKCKVAFK